jgi:hypothetical protein
MGVVQSLKAKLGSCLSSTHRLAAAGLAGVVLAAGGTAHASDNLRFTSAVTLNWDGSCSDPDWTGFAVDVLIDTTTADVTTDVFGTIYVQDFFIFYLVDGNNTILDHQGFGPLHPTTDSAHTALLWTPIAPASGPLRYVFRDETDGTPDFARGATYDQSSDTLLLGQIAFDAQALDPDCPAGAPTRVSQIIRDTPAVSPTNADTLTWAISFNTGVTNVTADDFTLSGTTATLGVIQDNSQSYRVTASGGDLASVNGTVTLGFAAGQNIQSTGGIALADTSVTGTNEPTYVLDNTAPTVSISGPAGPVQGAFTATITFSEAVSGFASNELTLTNATLGSFSGSGTTYTAIVTPSGDGTVTVDVGAGVASDSVGNGNTAATQYSVTADGTAPRVASIERQTPAASPTNANSVIWRVAFSEAVSNVDVFDFTVFGSTAGVTNVTNSSGNFWDVTVSGGDLAVMNGTITLGLAGGQNISDTAGNALTNTTPTGTNNNSFVIDNIAPALTAFVRNTPAGEKTNADTLVFDISFNEAVANVSADDFTITGTTASGVLAGSGSAYTLTLSGGNLATYNGIVGLNLAGGQNITDTAGNALPAGEPGTDQTYDVRNTAPALASITRSSPLNSPTNADSLVWDFAFSAIDGSFTLPANAFTVSGTTATVTNVTRYSIGLQVTVSGGDLASLNGNVTIGLANTDFADDFGNVMDRTIPAGAELTYTVDNTAPTLAITPAGPVNAAFTATFTFSEAMSGFEAGDVQVLNGAATNFAGSGAVYTATITPAAQGDVTIFVNLGSATDLAGNSMEGGSRIVRFDSIPPTVSLSGPSGNVNAAFDVSIQFTETVTGLAVGDFTVGNGTASNLTGSGQFYNVTITPAGDGPVTVDLAAGVANDAAGNGNTAATQFSITMDATAPTVSIGVPTGPVSGAVTVTFTFSENVTGFSSGDIVATGANVSNFQSLSQSSYSARITPTASGTVNLSILAGTVTDLTSNPIALTTASFVADLTAPTLVVSGPAGPVSGAFTATFTFSESVTGFDAGDILFSRGSASNFAGSGAVYTATITPNQEGQVLIFVPAEVASDAAGNLNSSGNYGVTYDATAPFITAFARNTPAGQRTNADTLVFDISFSEAVTNVSADDFEVSGTTATGVLAGSGSAYTLTLSGGDLASYNGIVGINLAGGQDITDLAGNAQPDAEPGTDETYDVRNLAPALASITRSSPATSPTNADSLVWDLSFSAIDGFFTLPANAFTVSGTTATVTDVSRYSIGFYVTVSGGDLASLDGDVTLGLANSDFADDYGNVMDRTIPGGAELTYTVDNTAPSITSIARQTPSSEATNSDTLVFAITFSESVANVSADDFSSTGTTATGVLAGSGADYTLTLSGGNLAGLSGVVGLTLSGTNDITDAVGNAVSTDTPATNETYTLDNAAPLVASIVRQTPTDNPTNASSVTWRVTFNETVSDLSSDDFSVSGTTATLSAGNVTATSVDVTASGGDMGTLQDTIILSFSGTQDITDSVGNPLTNTAVQGSDESSWTIDRVFPTVTITGPAGPVSGAFTATFTFSEDVTGFELGDISVANGAASDFSGSGAIYTATITPVADGSVTVDVALDVASDAADNGNLAATQFSVTNDETAPTLTISGPSGPVSGVFTATFTFNEDVTGFELGDISVANGAASDLSGSGAVYTATITPSADGSVTVDVAGGAAADAAGNDNTAASQFSVTNDETAPALTITGPSGLVSGVFTATFTFNEDVTDFALSDIAVTNGAASNLGGSGAVYTASITPEGDGLVTVGVDAGAASDAAGNANTAATPYVVTNDGTAPTVTITGPAGPVDGAFTATFSFSEPVTGFTPGDITVGNGSASNLTGSDASYTATITPVAAGQVSVNLASGVTIDAAGNGNLAATAFAVVFDPVDRRLSATFSGLGSGRLTSTPAGLDCTTDCFADFDINTSVRVTATALPGSVFRRWTSGPCAGTRNGACIIPLSDDTEIGALFSLEAPVQGRVVTAVLPGARSSYVGGPVMTAYLTAVSAAGTPAQSCYVSTPSNAPVTMTSQRLDSGGAPTGPLNPVFDLEAGGSASFVLAMTPASQTDGYNLYPLVTCTNIAFDPVPGVNSILLTIDDVPVPDILSTGATPSGDGVIRIPASGRAQVMTAAAVNIGAGDGSAGAGEVTLTVSADTGPAVLPVSLEMCQIDAAAQCITPRAPSVTANMPGNTPLFFAVFVRDTSEGAGVAFDPANARVFMRFADATGTIRSVTSAAVIAPAAADIPAMSMVPEGRWSVLMRREDGGWPGLVRTAVHVAANGVTIVDDGVQPRLAVLDPAFDAGVPGRFRQAGTDGRWTSDGMIRLGAAWATTPGEFWGVRDARSDNGAQWRDLAGTYGGSVHISETGEIRGIAGGCAVYGQTAGAASSVTVLSLTGCAMSGSYAAVIDLPANDNDAPVLVIAGQSAGWRLAQ